MITISMRTQECAKNFSHLHGYRTIGFRKSWADPHASSGLWNRQESSFARTYENIWLPPDHLTE